MNDGTGNGFNKLAITGAAVGGVALLGVGAKIAAPEQFDAAVDAINDALLSVGVDVAAIAETVTNFINNIVDNLSPEVDSAVSQTSAGRAV